MVGKLNRLPVETQKALQQLACLGNSADDHDARDRSRDLGGGGSRGSVGSGPLGAGRAPGGRLQVCPRPCPGSRLFADPGDGARRGPSPDRQAARGADASGEAGRGDLRDRQSAQPRRGADHLREEREQLAELNLIAGKRAKASTAYASALNYLVAGAALLPEDAGSAGTS